MRNRRHSRLMNMMGMEDREKDSEDGEPVKEDHAAKAAHANIFVDCEEMKRKVRENLMKPAYDVADFYHKTGLWRNIATASWFEKLTLAVIALNAMWIGVDTDWNKGDTLLEAQPQFQIAEHIFCLFFAFEWFSRFMSFRRKRDGLKDPWYVFDSILVLMMVMETWVLTCVMLVGGGSGSGGLGNASILRMARLARLSRMARMARLLRAMPELMILIKGIVAATRSVFFTLALLCLLMYIFAIMFTQLTKGSGVGDEYFITVGESMYTLLVFGTLLDNITMLLNELGAESYIFGALFLMFVLLAALTLMNMLIGVLTEVVSAVAATEKESLTVTFVKNKMEQALKEIDEDGDGNISKKEFEKILESKDATEALSEVDVDVVGLVDFADFIFADDEGGTESRKLDLCKFMEVVLQFRGSNNATVKDIVNLRKFVSNSLKTQRDELQELKEMVLTRAAYVTASQHKGGNAKGNGNGSSNNFKDQPSYKDTLGHLSQKGKSTAEMHVVVSCDMNGDGNGKIPFAVKSGRSDHMKQTLDEVIADAVIIKKPKELEMMPLKCTDALDQFRADAPPPPTQLASPVAGFVVRKRRMRDEDLPPLRSISPAPPPPLRLGGGGLSAPSVPMVVAPPAPGMEPPPMPFELPSLPPFGLKSPAAAAVRPGVPFGLESAAAGALRPRALPCEAPPMPPACVWDAPHALPSPPMAFAGLPLTATAPPPPPPSPGADGQRQPPPEEQMPPMPKFGARFR